MRGAAMGWRNRGPSAAEAISFSTAHDAPEGAPFQSASWFQSLEISTPVSFCLRAHLHGSVPHPSAAVAAALLLGRSGLLHPGGARFAADGLAHSAYHALQCASTAGDDLARVLVEVQRLHAGGDAYFNADSGSLRAAGALEAVARRGQRSGCLGYRVVHGPLPGFLCAEFAGASRYDGSRPDALGTGNVYRAEADGDDRVLRAGVPGEGDGNHRSYGVVRLGAGLSAADEIAW